MRRFDKVLARYRRPALGVLTDVHFEERFIELVSGELLCLVTDGLSNLKNEAGKTFGSEQLQSSVAALEPDSAGNVANTLLEAFNEFAGNAKQSNGLACLVLGISTEITATESSTLKLILRNDSGELTRLAEALDEFSDQNEFSEKTRFELQLCLEELVLNVIDNGFDDLGEHDIQVDIRFECKTGSIIVQVVDDGRKFNPLEETMEQNLDASLDDRNIGGLGFQIVRSFMDDIHYRRESERNHLTLTKNVESRLD